MRIKPYTLFFSTAVCLIIYGLAESVVFGDTTFDVNVHDNYYVIAYSHLAYLISTYFFLAGLAYWILAITGFRINKLLTKIHIAIILGGLAIYPIFHLYRQLTSNPSDFLFDDYYEWENRWVTVMIIMLLLAQLVFLTNIIVTLSTRRRIA